MKNVSWILSAVVLMIALVPCWGVAVGQEAGELAGPISVVGDDAAPASSESSPLGASDEESQQQSQGLPLWFWFPLIGLMVFMFWSSSSQQKKIRREHEALMSSLTKHDRVQTSGGIIGTIQEMHGDELVLKVDESSGTRIRFSKGSISKVLSESHLRGKVEAGSDDSNLTNKNEELTTA